MEQFKGKILDGDDVLLDGVEVQMRYEDPSPGQPVHWFGEFTVPEGCDWNHDRAGQTGGFTLVADDGRCCHIVIEESHPSDNVVKFRSESPLLWLDRRKPFYPLVMNYVVQLAGWMDMVARPVVGPPDATRLIEGRRQKGADADALARLEGRLAKLLGPLQLRCECSDTHMHIERQWLATELVDNHSYLIRFIMRAAGSLLILAHEITKDQPYRDTGPLWEFLRHCRNAAAHTGRFTFIGEEPKRPAEWRTLRIERNLQGTPLFKDDTGEGLLSPGDPIHLLADIEGEYPNITCEE